MMPEMIPSLKLAREIADSHALLQRIASRLDNSHDKPDTCESCTFEIEDLNAYKCSPILPQPTTTHKWLCNLCASTVAGNIADIPRDDRDVIQTICYVGNMILADIRKGRDLK